MNGQETLERNFDTEIHVLELEKKRLAQYDSLIRKLFYACEYCDGALIQLANCIVCKRAVVRKCIRCNTELCVTHTMCISTTQSKLTNIFGLGGSS